MKMKRVLSIALALCLCLSLLPGIALAEEQLTVKIGSTFLTSETYYKVSGNAVSGQGASSEDYQVYWDGTTLTLNGLNFSYGGDASAVSITHLNSNFTVKLIGENTVSGTKTGSSSPYNSCGVYVNADDATNAPTITFTSVDGGSLSATGEYNGILCTKGNLKFDGANVTATGKAHGGIFTSAGAIDILNSTVRASSASTVGEDAIGTNNGSVTIDNSKVTATLSGTGHLNGIRAGTGSTVAITNNSEVNITETANTDYTYGIYCDQAQISNSTVTIANTYYGIRNGSANNTVSVNSANVNMVVRYASDSANYTVDAASNVWYQKAAAVTIYGACTPPEGMDTISGALTIMGGGQLTIDSGRTFTTSAGTLTNNGIIDNQGEWTISGSGLAGTVNNSGTLKCTYTYGLQNMAKINNTGTVNAAYGIVNRGGGEITGNGQVNALVDALTEGSKAYSHEYTTFGTAEYRRDIQLGKSISAGNSYSYVLHIPENTSLTIPEGKTLNAAANDMTVDNLSERLQVSGSLIVNGTIVLPEGISAEQIKALHITGNGQIKVGEDLYTNDGEKRNVLTGDVDLTGEGSTSDDETVYTYEAGTLTVKENAVIAGNVTLPAGNTNIVLDDGAIITGLISKEKDYSNNSQNSIDLQATGNVRIDGGIAAPAPSDANASTEIRVSGGGTIDVVGPVTADSHGTGVASVKVESGTTLNVTEDNENFVGIRCDEIAVDGALNVHAVEASAIATSLIIGSNGKVTVNCEIGAYLTGDFKIIDGGYFKANTSKAAIIAKNIILPDGYMPDGYEIANVYAVPEQLSLLALGEPGGENVSLMDLETTDYKTIALSGSEVILSGSIGMGGDIEGAAESIELKKRSGTNPGVNPGVTGSYTLSFETNGGSAVPEITKASGETVDLSAYKPTFRGFTFEGWYTDKELQKAVTELTLSENTTVYAKWKLAFTDVPENAWYYSDVEYVTAKGLFTGLSDTIFAPDTAMTRAMLVTVLWRMENSPEAENAGFSDVAADAWYAMAVNWAKAKGVVEGYNGAFDPDDEISREQLATILFKYAKLNGAAANGENADMSAFTDASSVSAYAIEAMGWAVKTGLINGSDGKLLPQGSATRAQVAAILQRYSKNK